MLRALIFVFICSGVGALAAIPSPATAAASTASLGAETAGPIKTKLSSAEGGTASAAPVTSAQPSQAQSDKDKSEPKEGNDYGTVIATLAVIGSIALKHIRGGKS